MSFEPYLDFDAITSQMAIEIRESMIAYKAAQDAIVAAEEPTPELAADLLRASEAASEIVREIIGEIHVTPVMVHVAGERDEEINPDDPTDSAIVQRCRRCGSILHMWHEGMGELRPGIEIDDLPWWPIGERVAKASAPGGIGMYPIEPPERQLQEHEHPCADLSSLQET